MSTVDQPNAGPTERRGPSRLSRGIGRQRTGDEVRQLFSGLASGTLLNRLQVTHQTQVERGFRALLAAGVSGASPATRTARAAVGQEETIASEYRVVLVDADALIPHPYRPPVVEGDRTLDRLAQNIREHGILEPLQVMEAPPEIGGASGVTGSFPENAAKPLSELESSGCRCSSETSPLWQVFKSTYRSLLIPSRYRPSNGPKFMLP